MRLPCPLMITTYLRHHPTLRLLMINRPKQTRKENGASFLWGVSCGVILSFLVCNITGAAVWKSVDSARSMATISAAKLTDPNLVIGLWDCQEITGGQMEIKRNYWGEQYIGIQASNDSLTTDKGEIILEFSFNLENFRFEGRHLWGGGKSTTTEWGKNGGVVMELRDANTLFVRFLDSIYTDGWVYTRVQ